MDGRIFPIETVLNSGSMGGMCNLCFFYCIYQYLLSIDRRIDIEMLLQLADNFNIRFRNQMVDMGNIEHLECIDMLLVGLNNLIGRTFRINIFRRHRRSNSNDKFVRELDGNSFGINDPEYTIDIFNIPNQHFELISEINNVRVVDTQNLVILLEEIDLYMIYHYVVY
jgi:hypothetical protein